MRRTRGRPSRHPVCFEVMMDQALLDAARLRANYLGVPIAEFVRRAIRDALDREPETAGGRNAR
jgi:hypothetical protein